MPFRNFAHEFTPATLDAMAAAYDVLVRELGIASSDPRSGQLAIKIAAIARAGEDDKDALIRKARESFTLG
jgi:hypothetical protein